MPVQFASSPRSILLLAQVQNCILPLVLYPPKWSLLTVFRELTAPTPEQVQKKLIRCFFKNVYLTPRKHSHRHVDFRHPIAKTIQKEDSKLPKIPTLEENPKRKWRWMERPTHKRRISSKGCYLLTHTQILLDKFFKNLNIQGNNFKSDQKSNSAQKVLGPLKILFKLRPHNNSHRNNDINLLGWLS